MLVAGAEWVEWYQIHQTHDFHFHICRHWFGAGGNEYEVEKWRSCP